MWSRHPLLPLLPLLPFLLLFFLHPSLGMRQADLSALQSLRLASISTNMDGSSSPNWVFDPLAAVPDREFDGLLDDPCGVSDESGARFIQCDAKGFITRL